MKRGSKREEAKRRRGRVFAAFLSMADEDRFNDGNGVVWIDAEPGS